MQIVTLKRSCWLSKINSFEKRIQRYDLHSRVGFYSKNVVTWNWSTLRFAFWCAFLSKTSHNVRSCCGNNKVLRKCYVLHCILYCVSYCTLYCTLYCILYWILYCFLLSVIFWLYCIVWSCIVLCYIAFVLYGLALYCTLYCMLDCLVLLCFVFITIL